MTEQLTHQWDSLCPENGHRSQAFFHTGRQTHYRSLWTCNRKNVHHQSSWNMKRNIWYENKNILWGSYDPYSVCVLFLVHSYYSNGIMVPKVIFNLLAHIDPELHESRLSSWPDHRWMSAPYFEFLVWKLFRVLIHKANVTSVHSHARTNGEPLQ